MTAIDPYRTLGLTPGASQAEIKHAYRHLAKLYHPDSAGDRALGRFLAIQAAYEALVDEHGRGRGYRRPSPAGRAPAPPSAPWQADASRARATREANRARTRRTSAASGSASGRGAAPDDRPSGGAPGGPAGPGAAGPRATSGRGATGDAGATAGRGSGAGATSEQRGRSDGSSGGRSRRSRGPKATIGSTSYDGADKEPFDPAWEGATWYGAGSGTYWTLNPKEYADPRKHGPEYLARSRRQALGATGGGALDRDEAGSDGAGSDSPFGDRDGKDAEDIGPSGSASWAGAAASAGAASTGAAAGSEPPAAAETPTGHPSGAGPAAAPPVKPTGGAQTRQPQPGSSPPPMGTPVASDDRWDSAAGVARAATTLPGRIVLAVIGWIPLGVALAIATDVMPACSGGSLVCADPLRAGIWPIHVLTIGLLASVPRLALIAAYGAAAFLLAGLVATPVLIAVGGTQTPTGTAAVLRVVLVAAWIGGIVFALSGRVDLPAWRGPRVR